MRKKKNLVVLSGAGISAESGLKTFRDGDGLWENHNVYEVATPEAWVANPELVLRFYNDRRKQVLEAEPNKAHQYIALLEDYYNVDVVTQNIDNLHERAGSSNVLHLHGNIMHGRSSITDDYVQEIKAPYTISIGDTAADGSQLRPDIVWFGEPVPKIDAAAKLVSQADIIVIVGTSLVVYPAAGLIHASKDDSRIFLVDNQDVNVPNLNHRVTKIIQPASIGCESLLKILLKDVE